MRDIQTMPSLAAAAAMAWAQESGESEQDERHYVHEQFDGWFDRSVVRLGDGVATTTKDITEWKKAREEMLGEGR